MKGCADGTFGCQQINEKVLITASIWMIMVMTIEEEEQPLVENGHSKKWVGG
uniref:Uncharacterized protein n=1 Tax=Hyaloperonospora arabidopsidis (strain Emoy2) TaxID=559515 RepID=M4BIL8_HYAAE